MSELAVFIQLGFRHITDPKGLDHVFFLLVLAAIYSFRDWRRILWVVTAFTIGHSLTLALAVTGVLVLPSRLIEFLIPLTILVTCLQNLRMTDAARAPSARFSRAMYAAVFGLVHGAGFANYLRSLFIDKIFVPLLGFNVGLEIGQILVLMMALALFSAFDLLLRRTQFEKRLTPARVRTVLVSLVVGVIAGVWSVQRAPW